MSKNVLIISHAGKRGPGSVAFNLLRGLIDDGYNAKLLVRKENQKLSNVISLESKFSFGLKNKLYKLKHIIETRLLGEKFEIQEKYYPYSLKEKKGWYKTKYFVRKFPFKPDIIILVFIDNFINSKNIREFYELFKCKIVWILPDMAALTGGCHYAWDCEGYKKMCGNCPAISSNVLEDITWENMHYKMRNLEKIPLVMLGGSEWNFRQLKESSLFKDKAKDKILVPLDPNIYEPKDVKVSKDRFGVPLNKKIIFFGAKNLENERKGFKYLLEALDYLYDIYDNRDEIALLIAGKISDDILKQIKFDYILTGFIDQEKELPFAFSAADVFVSPSIEDSGPMMVNQSILCGTPVVAFEMGVALDLIVNAKTGYIAKLFDSRDLANGISQILKFDCEKTERMKKSCRQIGLKATTLEIQIKTIEGYF